MLLHDLRAPSCSTSTPISFSTLSEARWIISSSSSEISLVGENGIFSCRNGGCSKARSAGAFSCAAAAAGAVGRDHRLGGLQCCVHPRFPVAVGRCGGIMDPRSAPDCGRDDH